MKLGSSASALTPQATEENADSVTGQSNVLNPFDKPASNDTLSFLGRTIDSEKGTTMKINEYRADNEMELYGPLWIFITMVIEFIILGHMSN
mmetsp:Transcript_8451/g.12903  ORF Transcript_8451/g.12903 Transcript_8451/m.12903 type:complete len:92 (-) Transcript_8451:466-741(-)|eukprot:CAMPEP_0170483726 /NCGR_PEP_ID=MMETSP0208-20121228/3354_1 /TAXON_ID=197538 /ORGANISM="Strombidium inclinatum, Strain S3" /LENGTH=91 /DNA_ID=CAMNT_0010756865 /DNA_START=690 /DNA_END=965 /DNA_ORIENTATION=-